VTEITTSLVLAAQQGDQTACREIVESLHRPIIATIFRFLGTGYRREVEDLAQEVFITAYRKLPDFRRGEDFGAWLRGIARNKRLHHHARARREQAIGDEAVVLELETGHALGLNETGSFIFGGVAAGRSKDEIVEGLVTRFRAPADEASRDFDELLTELERKGVVGHD